MGSGGSKKGTPEDNRLAIAGAGWENFNQHEKSYKAPNPQNKSLKYRKGLKVVTIEIIEIVTTIIVTTFKHCKNLNML